MLGGEVPLTLAPSRVLPGGVAIEIGGGAYEAALGETRLGVGKWRLVVGGDGWVELATQGGPPAYANGLELAGVVTLLRGDTLTCERGGEVVLRVER
jgi:hypothetical protein